jgi:hypothetical protein
MTWVPWMLHEQIIETQLEEEVQKHYGRDRSRDDRTKR